MAMPRPLGKAKEIAEKVVPGLDQNRRNYSSAIRRKKRGNFSHGEVESKIIHINEVARRRSFYENKKR